MLQVRGGGRVSRSTSSEMVRMSLAKGEMRARVLKVVSARLPRGRRLHWRVSLWASCSCFILSSTSCSTERKSWDTSCTSGSCSAISCRNLGAQDERAVTWMARGPPRRRLGAPSDVSFHAFHCPTSPEVNQEPSTFLLLQPILSSNSGSASMSLSFLICELGSQSPFREV